MVKINDKGWTIDHPCLDLHVRREELKVQKEGKEFRMAAKQSRGKKAGRAGEGGKARWIFQFPDAAASAVPFSLHASACVAIDMTAPNKY